MADPVTTTPHPPGSPWPAKEAASFLSVSYRHLLRMVDGGKVKTIRFCRKLLVPADEVQRLAREGCR